MKREEGKRESIKDTFKKIRERKLGKKKIEKRDKKEKFEEIKRKREELSLTHGESWKREAVKEMARGLKMEWAREKRNVPRVIEGSVAGSGKRKRGKRGRWLRRETEEMETDEEPRDRIKRRRVVKAKRPWMEDKKRQRLAKAEEEKFAWQLW